MQPETVPTTRRRFLTNAAACVVTAAVGLPVRSQAAEATNAALSGDVIVPPSQPVPDLLSPQRVYRQVKKTRVYAISFPRAFTERPPRFTEATDIFVKFNIDAKRSDLKNRNHDLGTLLSDLDAIRADVWARAKAFPFFKIPKSEPYTLKRFQDYLCFDLPKVVVEFGAHVRTDVVPLRVSSDERSAGMLELVPRFFDISSPKHERIRLCGVEFERALVALGGPIPSAVVSRSFLESLPTVVPGGICSTHGNILYSPLAVQETYSTFLDDLRQMLSLKGRPLADIVRELDGIDNPEKREVRALQLAYGLALVYSCKTLNTVDTYLQNAVHAHEDYHLVNVYSGRSIEIIAKPVNNTFAAFEKAEYETSYASERSVYLKECTHFGSLGFGLAVMLRFCALHKMKPADPQGEYMAAAGNVIEALVSHVAKEPQKFGIAVDLSPKLTQRQQVLLQLTKIHDSQANLEDLRRKME